MIVYVVGLPGSGKTYYANKLAQTFGFKYMHIESLFKDVYKKSSEEILSSPEAKNFWVYENGILLGLTTLTRTTKANMIVEVFPDTPCRDKILEFMQANSKIIYIDSSPENIYENLVIANGKKGWKNYPIYKDCTNKKELISRIEELDASHREWYEKADMTIYN